jgi:hypothetical protein
MRSIYIALALSASALLAGCDFHAKRETAESLQQYLWSYQRFLDTEVVSTPTKLAHSFFDQPAITYAWRWPNSTGARPHTRFSIVKDDQSDVWITLYRGDTSVVIKNGKCVSVTSGKCNLLSERVWKSTFNRAVSYAYAHGAEF